MIGLPLFAAGASNRRTLETVPIAKKVSTASTRDAAYDTTFTSARDETSTAG